MKNDLKIKVYEEVGLIEICKNNETIGGALYRRENNEIFIEEFEIKYHYRGKGYGSKSYKIIKDYFRKDGIKIIKLVGSEGNRKDPFNINNPYDFWTLTCNFKKRENILIDEL